jgi:hypothetical protein
MPEIIRHADINGTVYPVYENGTTFPYLINYKLLVVTPYKSGWQDMKVYCMHPNPQHKENIKELKKLFGLIGMDARNVKIIR